MGVGSRWGTAMPVADDEVTCVRMEGSESLRRQCSARQFNVYGGRKLSGDACMHAWGARQVGRWVPTDNG